MASLGQLTQNTFINSAFGSCRIPMLFISHAAVAFWHKTFVWVCLKWLHKISSPNKAPLSSKTLMYKKDISNAKCPPVVSLPKIASHPDLDGSVFNKKLRFGIYIGTN